MTATSLRQSIIFGEHNLLSIGSGTRRLDNIQVVTRRWWDVLYNLAIDCRPPLAKEVSSK
ncbi:integrase [Sesbania bispinosa]|nr:integrase [Sesbania bispinosa]